LVAYPRGSRYVKYLSRSGQKTLKGIHLIVAGLWLSCVVVLLALPVVARRISSGDELYMYNYIYYHVDMFLLTPAAIATLTTGLLFSIFTRWFLWLWAVFIYKWAVTLAIVGAGTFYLGPLTGRLLDIADSERLGALQNEYYLRGETISIWAAIVNTSLLIIAVLFSVYKPWKNIRR
jgi:hypothetical protein